MLFKDIIGQQEVTTQLLNLVKEGRIPHALLLYGPHGSGKLALAVAMARYVACTRRGKEDACGVCPSCLKIAKLIHPDLHFVVPVLKTSRVPNNPVTDLFMDEWRQTFLENPYLSEKQWYEAIGAENKQGAIHVEESKQIIRKLNFKPYESDYKMMILWLPEKLNQSAANKLLKMVEEPPDRTLVIMVTENTERILPTILSRTQLLYVPPLSDKEIEDGLRQEGHGDMAVVEDAVRKAGGNFNVAQKAIRQDARDLGYFEDFTSLMRLCYSRKIIGINEWVERVALTGRERQKEMLEYSLILLRESFMVRLQQKKLNRFTKREEAFAGKFSPFIHYGNIHDLVGAFNEAANHIEANGNPRIILLDLSIQVIRLLVQKEQPV